MKTWAVLSRYLHVHCGTLEQWRSGICLPKLATVYKLGDIAGVPKNSVHDNIVYVTPWRKFNAIPFMRRLKFDEELAEWFGLLNGDGCIPSNPCKVGFSNKDPKLLQFFMRVLQNRFGISEHLFLIAVRVPASLKSDVKTIEDLRLEWGEKLSFPQHRVKVYLKYTSGIAADMVVHSGALARILMRLKPKVKEIVGNGPMELKRAYLRGCYAAEGSVIKRNRYVTFSGKNTDEVTFVCNLLASLEIEHSLYHSGGGCWQVRVSNRRNLIKFCEKVGFGINEQRQGRLEKALASYKYLPPEARASQIFDEISGNRALTASQLARELGLSRKWTWVLLHRLAQRRFISVNKGKRPYMYSMADTHDSTLGGD